MSNQQYSSPSVKTGLSEKEPNIFILWSLRTKILDPRAYPVHFVHKYHRIHNDFRYKHRGQIPYLQETYHLGNYFGSVYIKLFDFCLAQNPTPT